MWPSYVISEKYIFILKRQTVIFISDLYKANQVMMPNENET